MSDDFITAVRELMEELNRNAASCIITHRALVLMNRVEQLLSRQ